jgi:hypothetical protein
MDEKQQIEAAGDVQDELASLMAVEPSPEFSARVRQRIAADAGARDWKSVHLAVPALAAIAVVVLGFVLVLTGSRRVAPEPPTPEAVTRVVQPAPAPSAPAAAVVAAPRRQIDDPPALVPTGEIVAVRQLLSAARAGRFEFELVPAGVPVADQLSAPGPISLPPIEMMPIGTSSSFE